MQGLLDELNKRLDEPLSMNRFRPNIVVTDCLPAAEDAWEEYTIGKDVIVESVKPCDRCIVRAPFAEACLADACCSFASYTGMFHVMCFVWL